MLFGTGGLILSLLCLLSAARARPTFDKIAEVLLNLADDRPYRGQPYGYARPPPAPHGPLIQEGYDQGYDYSYAGGAGHAHHGAVVANSPYGYQQPPPYYNYGEQPSPYAGYDNPAAYGAQQPYGYAVPNYGQGYGSQASVPVVGYKQRGY